MLVDGCLIDNVPLEPMHQLKSGPNLVVHFGEPATEMFDVDYAALPGRFELLAAMLMPFRKKLLPAAPSAVNVLWRSLVAHQRYDTLPAAPLDHVMRPPIPHGVDVTDFERHAEIFERPTSGPGRPSRRWRRMAIRRSKPFSTPARWNGVRRRLSPPPISRPAIASLRPLASVR